jgi:outer membrane protein assembly factor BamD
MRRATLLFLLILAASAASGCAPSFQPRRFRTAPDLYAASLREFERKKWDNALQGFDLLAQQLPARDTLLPRVYWYQAQAHSRKREHLLAAQAYDRLTSAFSDDSLADRALFETGLEYRKLWRKPALDTQYGETALQTFRALLERYPDSPYVQRAGQQIAELNEMFARKDYDTGLYYLRRKAYDSAVIYFKDVVRLYPGTPSARLAYLRMVDAYQAINYREDIAEVCTEARKFYPDDAAVRRACGAVPAVDTARAPPRPVIPAPR